MSVNDFLNLLVIPAHQITSRRASFTSSSGISSTRASIALTLPMRYKKKCGERQQGHHGQSFFQCGSIHRLPQLKMPICQLGQINLQHYKTCDKKGLPLLSNERYFALSLPSNTLLVLMASIKKGTKFSRRPTNVQSLFYLPNVICEFHQHAVGRVICGSLELS